METAINTLKFVDAAKSTDTTRPNICEIYQDRGRLVATEGHRLHMGPVPENGGSDGYLSGIKEIFPDYKMIIPKNTISLGTLIVEKKTMRTFKKFVELVKQYDAADHCGAMQFAHDTLRVSCDFTSMIASMELDGLRPWREEPLKILINLKYLLDALVHFADKEIEIFVNVDDVELGALQFVCDEHTAIIMPMRDK